MAVIKCKMCGGELVLSQDQTVAECEYCGSRQTVPKQDDEKKLLLFERAERLRKNCEFDKAAGLYESIVSEFRQEPEAYWGLVLCRYGIEYVDDPATGRKIPTCHRSSFESVMEDQDLDLTLEYADGPARRVYREEAKQIEELRRSIIAVSANEAPYDIFICYKETDDSGDRTLDSVLAQDIYDALTAKGYRVFFSRISLEDKLGIEFEPYIFAALNSARVMLAVGTDYEYYNAVWVKNEWSRFLKLMAKDKQKHLIPCFKGLDAYDMPKEFARLQAQDLGKVGAMQDLMRGIEKLLPRETAAPEPVSVPVAAPVQAPGYTALLKRGNMTLEDGNWERADGFFEEVLNQDAECAEAYLGKVLAASKVPTLEALADRRPRLYGAPRARQVTVQPDKAQVDALTEKYSVPDYMDPKQIRDLFRLSVSYQLQGESAAAQQEQEEKWWENDRDLLRVRQFGSPALLQRLEQARAATLKAMADRTARTGEEDRKAEETARQQLGEAMDQAEAAAKKIYDHHEARRYADYRRYVQQMELLTDISQLRLLVTGFDKLGDYRDCREKADSCLARIRELEEQARRERADSYAALVQRIDAAEELRELREILARLRSGFKGYEDSEAKIQLCRDRIYALEAEEAAKSARLRKENQRLRRKKTVILAVIVILLLALTVVTITVILPVLRYSKAENLLAEGRYKDAAELFSEIGDYKDSSDRVTECNYLLAEDLLAEGRYEDAIKVFMRLGNYKDSPNRIPECNYLLAESLLERGDLTKAALCFGKLGEYSDARERSLAVWDQLTVPDTIAAGDLHSLGLKANGTVVAVGYNEYGRCDTEGWSNIMAISAGDTHSLGLRTNGTVVALGNNKYGQCNVKSWSGISAISAGCLHSLGLKADGTVVAVGGNEDGQCDVTGWSNIAAISAGNTHSLGLKTDGTVVAVGDNSFGRCNVEDWSNIVAISAGTLHSLGLRADGTVVAVGYNEFGQCDVESWSDIVAIAAGGHHSLGLKADGTVVVVGMNKFGQCDVESWSNIVAISAGNWHTLGVKADGTVIAVGDNQTGQRNVRDWTDIRLPD